MGLLPVRNRQTNNTRRGAGAGSNHRNNRSNRRNNRSNRRNNRSNRRNNRSNRQNANNQANNAFHMLPFRETFSDYLSENRDKEHALVLGIGTSGSSDVKLATRFAQMENEFDPRKGFFLLMIDTEYTHEDQRRTSLDPLEELGFHLDTDEHNYAFHPASGIFVYLWGTTLPTSYVPMEKYSELRNDPEGAYSYGKQCVPLSERTQDFYDPLLSFFRVPSLRTIYVYNQGVWDNSDPQYLRSRNSFYTGPSFTGQSRLLYVTAEEIMSGARPRGYRGMISLGVYFENFCELLYTLWNSEKPVYLLKNVLGTIVRSNLYRGEEPSSNNTNIFSSSAWAPEGSSSSTNRLPYNGSP